jgi:hypothetical protein
LENRGREVTLLFASCNRAFQSDVERFADFVLRRRDSLATPRKTMPFMVDTGGHCHLFSSLRIVRSGNEKVADQNLGLDMKQRLRKRSREPQDFATEIVQFL